MLTPKPCQAPIISPNAIHFANLSTSKKLCPISGRGSQALEHFDFSDFQFPTSILEVDVDRDKEALIKVFQTEMNQSADQIGEILEGWKQADHIITNAIVKSNGEVIAHSMAIKFNKNPTQGMMTHISIYETGLEHLRDPIFKYVVQKMKAAQLEQATFSLGGVDIDPHEVYSELKLEWNEIKPFEINL